MISIIDCEIGNLRSVQKAFEFIDIKAEITSDATEILKSRAIVLPGVGAFRDAMTYLTETGLDDVVRQTASAGVPFLGICLGMQMFADVSREGGSTRGLGLMSGSVEKLPDSVKVPEMGWNTVEMKKNIPIFKDIPDGARFYFAHSYYYVPAQQTDIAGVTDYGVEYASVVARDNVFGTQFHPEKSGRWGLQILRNFAKIA